MVALAWQWFKRLFQRGKDPGEFVYNFTKCLVRAVSAGSRVTGMQKTKDVMSPRCQRMRGFKVESLPMSPRTSHEELYGSAHGQREHDAFEETAARQQDDACARASCFRIDFPVGFEPGVSGTAGSSRTWHRTIAPLIWPRSTAASPGRISQKREQYKSDWDRFNGEPVVA